MDCQCFHVPTRLGLTHVIVSGADSAPPLVLLHGMRATALVWRPNVADLARHFRVYAIDIIGQNGKSVSSRWIRHRRDYASWLNELFDAVGIKRASLVGNSYGGFLALNQASLAPARVDRVVLINPAGIFVSVLPVVCKVAGMRFLQTLRLQRQSRPQDIATLLGRNVRLEGDDREWADMVGIIAFSREMRPNIIYPSVFPTAELHGIRTPTLLLMGDNDLLYEPEAVLRKARERMPSLQACMLPGAHHIASMAQPRQTNTHILRFLGVEHT